MYAIYCIHDFVAQNLTHSGSLEEGVFMGANYAWEGTVTYPGVRSVRPVRRVPGVHSHLVHLSLRLVLVKKELNGARKKINIANLI